MKLLALALWMAVAPVGASAQIIQNASELEGFWSGGLSGTSSTGQRISLEYALEAVGSRARLVANGRGWGADYSGPNVTCEYFLELEGFTVTSTLVAPGAPAICPAPDGLTMDLHGGSVAITAAGLEVFGPVELVQSQYAVPDADLSVLPEGFDVLGVAPRQTLKQVEDNLIDARGWQIATSYLTKYRNSPAAALARLYVKNDQTAAPFPEANYQLPADQILVGFMPAADATQAEGPDTVAAFVMRKTLFSGVGQQVGMAALQSALDDKHGQIPPDPMTGLWTGTRHYDRNGMLHANVTIRDRAPCQDLDILRRDRVVFTWLYEDPVNRGDIDDVRVTGLFGCSAEMDIRVFEDGKTGAVQQLEVRLIDQDSVVNAGWFLNAIAIRDRIAAAVAVAIQPGVLPEL